MNDPIADYLEDVAEHLKARGQARRLALADLESALRETAAALTDSGSTPASTAAAAAVAEFGPAEAYAAALDAELGTGRRLQTLLGVPNSLAPGAMERMAATFDPSDERILVPHVFGIGWAVNAGAIAARLGLLNPDDLDDDLLAKAAAGPGAVARAVSWGVIGTAVAGTIAAHRRRTVGIPARRNTSDLLGVALAVAVATALTATASAGALPPRQRLVAPAYATLLASVVIGDQAGARSDGSTSKAGGGLGLLAGALLWFASTYGPVRAEVQRRVHDTAADLGSSRGPSSARGDG